MKKIILSLLIIIGSLNIFAQQEAMFTHYMDNTLAINSAYAGSRDALTILGLNRSQWVGFEGAPVTQTLTLHSPVFTKNTGLGLSIINDKIGPLNNTSFFIDFSYRIAFKQSYLAFGLKSGFEMIKLGLSELNTSEIDPAFASDYSSMLMPNFGVGILYYTDKYYIGISSPKILQNNLFNNTTSNDMINSVRHYYIIGGYVFNINENIKLKPTTFVKMTPAAPIEADLTATFFFYEKFIAGMMYRTGDAAGVLVGYNITPILSVGYSFDWSFANMTGKYNAGSHEIMVRYDFFILEKKKIRSPRYF